MNHTQIVHDIITHARLTEKHEKILKQQAADAKEVYLGFKREFSKLIGFLVVSLVAVGLVFNADGVKDILLELFNKIIGA